MGPFICPRLVSACLPLHIDAIDLCVIQLQNDKI